MDTKTALTLVFPENTHQPINEIRSKYDKAYPRWFPHINLLFPFVPVDKFAEVADRLKILANFGKFTLNMNQIGYFEQGATATFHLKPENDAQLQGLFALIRETLPEIPSKHEAFAPHLTIGQFPKEDAIKQKTILEAWLDEGIKITVDRIHLISRDGDTPFKINQEILLYNPPNLNEKIAKTQKIKKAVEKINFSNTKMVAFIDNSGSTAGNVLKQEVALATVLFYPRSFLDSTVFWNNTAVAKPRQVASSGGTYPKCIFANNESNKMFADCEVVLFMTDGEIEPSAVTEFANGLKNHLNKYLFICIIVTNNDNINYQNLNVSVIAPMMVGANVLCLHYDIKKQKSFVLASKGEVSKKYPNPSFLESSKMQIVDFQELVQLEITKTNVPSNCLVIEETNEDYIIMDMNEVANCDLMLDLSAKAWEILIQQAVVSGSLDKIRTLVSKSRNREIQTEKEHCRSDFQFNYVRQLEELLDKMAKAYVDGNVEEQQKFKKLADEIKDDARKEELAYAEFVKARLDVIRGKWDSIRNIMSNFDDTQSKFSLNNFAFGSNRANRAKTIMNDDEEMEERITFGSCPEIDCVVCVDKGPAVLWLNKFDDAEYTTNDFCINFPLASYPALQKIFVNNPVCGNCAKHYLKYSQQSVYRQPLIAYIPTVWDTSVNARFAHNTLCRTICDSKVLHHVKLLLISLLDDNNDNWMDFREKMVDSLIKYVYTTETLSEEGSKVPFIKMLEKIITDEENLLRQPFVACMRILNLCSKYLKINKDIIIDLTRKRFAYLLIEIYCNATKKTPIEVARNQLQAICFETICGIPVENSARLCNLADKDLVQFINSPSVYQFMERLANNLGATKEEMINSKVITNILWHLQLLATHERPWTVYTNLMKTSKLFRGLGEEPDRLVEFTMNKGRFGKYKQCENPFVPPYAYYNGENSGPTKFYFGSEPLWSEEWNGQTITIPTLGNALRIRLQNKMAEKYGSYYPNNSSAHVMLHKTVAKILEQPKFKQHNKMTDEMILECLNAFAETNGNYGNIYRANTLQVVINTIQNFIQIRTNLIDRATGEDNCDKTTDHKIKCELLEYGFEIVNNSIIFDSIKLSVYKQIMEEIPDMEEIKKQVEKLYLQKMSEEKQTDDNLATVHIDDVITIGDANIKIEQCLESWKQEQREMVGKIRLIDSPNLVNIKYLGGADLSWGSNELEVVGCIVVNSYPSLKPVCQITAKFKINIPYKAGFLAFREVPVYLKLVDLLYQHYPEYVPQLMLIDGNGVWHPEGCGAATHFSLLSGIPAIGVAKNVLFTDGIGRAEVEKLLKDGAPDKDQVVEIIGNSGRMLGYAYNATGTIKKAIYLSAGNNISHEKALEIVRSVNKYRISETIRQADKLSRMLVNE